MSGRIVGEVLDHAPEDLSPLEFKVLIALAESARERDRIATHRTTRDDLAYRARSTPASIKNAIRNLRDRGLIKPVNGHVHRGVAPHFEILPLTPDHRSAVWKRGITR